MPNRWKLLLPFAFASLLTTACEKQEAAEPQATAETIEEAAEEAQALEVAEEAAAEKLPEPAEEGAAAPADATTAAVGQPAPAFTLTDEAGQTHSLTDYKGKVVVLEWTNPGCPYVQRHYQAKTMQNTYDALGKDDVVWLAVDSSHTVKPEDSARWKAEQGFTYPVLQDPQGSVGQLYAAKTTPHMYVIDAEGVLRYAGAIDNDPRGEEKEIRNYVRQAVQSLQAGGEVEEKEVKPYGCSVKYAG